MLSSINSVVTHKPKKIEQDIRFEAIFDRKLDSVYSYTRAFLSRMGCLSLANISVPIKQ